MSFKKILVGTDFSAGSRRAAEVAIEVAKLSGGLVRLIHGWEPFLYPRPLGDSFAPEPPILAGIEEAAKAALKEELAALQGKGIAVEGVMTMATPGDAVLAEAKRWGAELIVVGTHGRGGLARVFLGSVAERIIRAAEVPVLTTRTPK